MSDAKTTVVIDDLFKKGKARGEIVIGFEGDTVTLGMWTISKATNPDFKNQTLLGVCRVKATATPKWSGDSFTLASDLEIKAWGNGYHISKAKKGADTTTLTWESGADCGFSMGKATYKITASGDTLTLSNDQGNMKLKRTTEIDKVDTKAEAKIFESQ